MKILSLVLFIISALSFGVMLISVVLGCLRGWKKSTFALCRTLIAGLFATATLAIWHRASATGGPLTSLSYHLFGKIPTELPALTDLPMFKGIAASITVPFEFTLLFVVFALFLLIPGYFIGKHMGVYPPQTEETPKLKTWDSLVGALANVACVTITLSLLYAPLTNIVHTVSEPLKTAASIADSINGTEMEFDAKKISAGIETVEKNIFYSLSTSLPIRANYAIITGTKDTVFPARNEITQTLNIFTDAIYLMEKPENFGKEQTDALVHIADYFIASDEHASLLSTLIASEIADELSEKGTTVAEKEFYTAISKQLADISPKTIQEDIATLRDIGILFIDHGVFSMAASDDTSDEELLIALAKEELIYGLLSEVYDNDRTRTLLGYTLAMAFEALSPSDLIEATPKFQSEIPTDLTDDDLHAEAALLARLFTLDLDALSEIESSSTKIKELLDIGMQSKLLDQNVKMLMSSYLEDLSPELAKIAESIGENLEDTDIESIKDACKTYYEDAKESGADMSTVESDLKEIAELLGYEISDAEIEEWRNSIP